MKKSKNFLVITNVPLDALEKVQKAVWDAGWWVMWNYSHVSFVMQGKWYFTPMSWANPTIWAIGISETVEEYHLEFICEKEKLEAVIWALKKAHPYEEVPIFIFEYYEV